MIILQRHQLLYRFLYGKKPNDYTYQLFKNPDSGENNFEKNIAKAFLRQHPDWENSKYWVHRAKQDTVHARCVGPYTTNWYESGISPLFDTVASGVGAGLASFLLISKKMNQNLDKVSKYTMIAAIPVLLIRMANNIKYIKTGSPFFEKNSNKQPH